MKNLTEFIYADPAECEVGLIKNSAEFYEWPNPDEPTKNNKKHRDYSNLYIDCFLKDSNWFIICLCLL